MVFLINSKTQKGQQVQFSDQHRPESSKPLTWRLKSHTGHTHLCKSRQDPTVQKTLSYIYCDLNTCGSVRETLTKVNTRLTASCRNETCRNQTRWPSANRLYFCNAWLYRPHSHSWVINQDCKVTLEKILQLKVWLFPLKCDKVHDHLKNQAITALLHKLHKIMQFLKSPV